jgi:hypothetical protein
VASPAEGIKDVLVSGALIGGASGWGARVGELSDKAPVVAVFDSGGRPGEVRIKIEYPSVQVIVRGEAGQGGYSAAYDKAEKIHAYLQGIDQNPAAFARLTSCVAIGFINWLGRDESDRPQFSLNFQLITEPITAGNRPL